MGDEEEKQVEEVRPSIHQMKLELTDGRDLIMVLKCIPEHNVFGLDVGLEFPTVLCTRPEIPQWRELLLRSFGAGNEDDIAQINAAVDSLCAQLDAQGVTQE